MWGLYAAVCNATAKGRYVVYTQIIGENENDVRGRCAGLQVGRRWAGLPIDFLIFSDVHLASIVRDKKEN